MNSTARESTFMPSSDLIQSRQYGERGPYVVLLHGGPGAPGEMAPVARGIESVCRIIEPLQRRSGGVPLSVEHHVEDLHDLLRDEVNSEPVHLVGHSWGAMLALTYAARHPEGIFRIILIGCGTFDRASRKVYLANMARRMDSRTRQSIDRLKDQLATETDPERRNELFADLGKILTRLQAVNPFPADSPVLGCDERGHEETWADVLTLQENGIHPAEFAAIRGMGRSSGLETVTMIHGDLDPHPGSMIFESLAPFIDDLQYRELSRCGHTPWMEREARDGFFEYLTECLGLGVIPDHER